MKQSLVVILLAPAILAVYLAAVYGPGLVSFIRGPDTNPAFFCASPDPTPRAGLPATEVLQDCAAGRTVTIATGQTVSIDLQSFLCVCPAVQWHNVAVSDGAVLGTLVPPKKQDWSYWSQQVLYSGSEEIALYEARKRGRSDISGVMGVCAGPLNCGGQHRWSVTIQVT